jgi:hypothetical protein
MAVYRSQLKYSWTASDANPVVVDCSQVAELKEDPGKTGILLVWRNLNLEKMGWISGKPWDRG